MEKIVKIKRINKDVLRFIFLITFQSFITPQILSAQNNEIDSLENIVNRSEEDSTKAYALREIAVLLEYSNPDSAFYLCGKALNLLRKNNPEQTDNNSSEFISPGIAANIYNTMGVTNWIKSDFPSALEYYFDALKLREALNDNRSISNIYNNIGVVYWDLSDDANALEYFFKSLEIRLTLGSKKNIAGSYNNIAGIYNNQKKYSEALAYYRKSLEIRKELGNKKKLSQSYTNIGILYNSVYEQRDSLDSTLKNWEIDDPVELLDSAMFYQKMALTIDKEISYDYGALFDNLALASIYIDKSQFHKAIGYYKKSIPIADSLHALKQASELQGGLSTCYKNIGNYKLAVEHHELYVEFKDKVFSAEKSK